MPKAVYQRPKTLYERSVERCKTFCELNHLPLPKITVVDRKDWMFDACAYYRPDTEAERKWMGKASRPDIGTGIRICLDKCAAPCGPERSRQWSWPGSTTDRTAYGVLAHELGHHVDWCAGERKGRYYSEYGESVMQASGEPPITSYAPDPSEWFSEMMRVYITNPALLSRVRPVTYDLLSERWKPAGGSDWLKELGSDVPDRVVRALENKRAKG